MLYSQVKEHIVIPTLKYLDPVIPYSDAAVELLLMTAAHESSGCKYLHQVNGPALGIYQMEPSTEASLHRHFLQYRRKLDAKVMGLIVKEDGVRIPLTVCNLSYATAMARVLYYSSPEALPSGYSGMSRYAKQYWNTFKGKATEDDYFNAYNKWRYEG